MITPSELEPIAVAVPSFQERCKRILTEAVDDPASIGVEFQYGLCDHLTSRAAVGDLTEFPAFFEALEEALKKPRTDLYDEVTSGLLNALVYACEDRNIELARIAACIAGPTARGEWEASYRWTHHDEEPPWL